MNKAFPLLAVAALLPQAAAPPTPEKFLPPVDAAGIACRLVVALQPSPGERAIIAYDPAYYPEITRELQSQLSKAGVFPVAVLNFEPPEIVAAEPSDSAAAKRLEDTFVATLRPLFANADIFVWMPARALAADVRWERLIETSHVRGIHFHWIEQLQGKSPEEIAARSRMYERAILDYAALSREQDRLIAALRGHTVHITTPEGTDLRLRVPEAAWFHKNDGDISPARARLAKSVRDREMEFPPGALRFIPDVASTEGRLLVAKAPTESGTTEGVTIEFSHGRAGRVTAKTNEEAFRAQLKEIGGDVDKVGEVVIGTSPLLATPLSSGELPYYGYGDGFVRISLGDNWESGGTNRSPSGHPLWLFLEHATVETDGTVLIRGGRLVK
jgi:leucyl aminopeptidase (aminopeptidase T)